MRAVGLLSRDLAPTGFTSVLEALVQGLPDSLCAVFVDVEGETVDLATRIDGFDARIAGAETAILLARCREVAARQGQGPVLELRLTGDARSVLARSVGRGYDLVLLTTAQGITVTAVERCAAAAATLRVEARIPAPSTAGVLRAVEFRPSEAGGEIPQSFVEDGVRRRVAAVLGILDDPVCGAFLIRTMEGEEMLMIHDRHHDEWRRE